MKSSSERGTEFIPQSGSSLGFYKTSDIYEVNTLVGKGTHVIMETSSFYTRKNPKPKIQFLLIPKNYLHTPFLERLYKTQEI